MMKLLVCALLLCTTVQPTRAIAYDDTLYKITAYCIHGTTRSGTPTRLGVAATDRNVIPQWTTFEIEGLGTYVSEDTGSGVIGNHIDIWMPSCRDAIQHGVQWRRIMIIHDETSKLSQSGALS